MAENTNPSPHIAGKFNVIGVVPGLVVVHKHGTIDLRTISLEKAIELHKEGFPYLQEVKSEATKVK